MIDSITIVGTPASSLRKQQRSVETRVALLRSAREIFARDGFEQARLEDIAANAGRTRGAFYDNFKGKEDVFCAIFEENADRGSAELASLLTGLITDEERLKALGKYLGMLSKDRERTLLNLEFKLYAVRHPSKRRRLTDLHRVMCLRCSLPEINQVFPSPGKRSTKAKLTGSLVLGGILDGLALNHLFNPEALNGRELARYLKLCLRDTLPGLHGRPARKAHLSIEDAGAPAARRAPGTRSPKQAS